MTRKQHLVSFLLLFLFLFAPVAMALGMRKHRPRVVMGDWVVKNRSCKKGMQAVGGACL